jgi:transposase InsO family protein
MRVGGHFETVGMPWKRTDALSERVQFITEWERRFQAQRGRVDVAELCRLYGVSRQTGYVWIRRYRSAGHDIRALEDQSRRPHSNPRAVPLEVEDVIVAARKAHPKWGPVLLRTLLVERFPKVSFPSPSCIANILRRRGMAAPRKQRRGRPGNVVVTPPFPECTAANQTWCMDFKGWFRLRTMEKCYPFTLLDAYSRFLLRCEAMLEPRGEAVQSVLDSAFREYGLPHALRSDGGPPFFAAQAPAALSALSIWLLRLGITVECIAPGKPQQNGRLERFHRTLKELVEPAADLRGQQRVLDAFRGEYNFERPHSALELATPGSIYRRSSQAYPRALLQPDRDLPPSHVERVDKRGNISWRRRRLFIGESLAYQYIGLWPTEGTRWEAYLGSILLGDFDGERPEVGFSARRRPPGKTMRLSLIDADF